MHNKTTVIICSVNRSDILSETAGSLLNQSVQDFTLLISAPDKESVPAHLLANSNVEVISDAPKGLPSQRNAGLKRASTPYILFIDDDVELAPNYIQSMQTLFDSDPDIVLSTGQVIQDGVNVPNGITRSDASKMLSTLMPDAPISWAEAYGCNMFVRTKVASENLFDETLPLYGWLEDLDFSIRCRRVGKVILNRGTGLVHLGTTRGRTTEVRYGYSQIANPYYIWRKLAEPNVSNVVFNHWLRYTTANIGYSVLFWIPRRGDRAGRLRGNLAAFRDLLTGKLHPGRVLGL